jgi:hypothetical protein
MNSQQGTATSATQTTGTKDNTYDLVSVLYHALQGAETCLHYLQDAEQGGDQELVRFFRDVQAWQRHIATQAKELLKQRLLHGDGREWNPEATIWNLKIMA